MTSVASNRKDPLLGNHLYHQALFSSRKGTNTLLTLLKEAIILPLPCSNVIHKVLLRLNFFHFFHINLNLLKKKFWNLNLNSCDLILKNIILVYFFNGLYFLKLF